MSRLTDQPDKKVAAGETYERAPFGGAPDHPSTRVVAERELGDDVWMVRKANGLESVASVSDLAGQVEPLRPGIEELPSALWQVEGGVG